MIHFMFKVTKKFHNIRFNSRSFVQANLIPPSGRKNDSKFLRFDLDCMDFHNKMHKFSDTGRSSFQKNREQLAHIIRAYHMVFSSLKTFKVEEIEGC